MSPFVVLCVAFLIGGIGIVVASCVLFRVGDAEDAPIAVFFFLLGVIFVLGSAPWLYRLPQDLAEVRQAVEQHQPPRCKTETATTYTLSTGISGGTVEVRREGNTVIDLGEKVDDGRWPNTPGVFYQVYDATPGSIAGSVTETTCVWAQGLAVGGSQTRYEVYLPS